MVKSALFKKSLRDMAASKAQFISIFIMAVLAVSIMTGLDCLWKTIEDQSASSYASTNYSDLWVTVLNPTEKEMWAVSRVSGVAKAEKRFTSNADTSLEGAPVLKVYTISDRSSLDLPRLKEGGFRSGNGAILDAVFAARRGIKIGDRFLIKINKKWVELIVEGFAYSSEQINLSKGSAGALPTHNNFGFVFIKDDILKSAYGAKVYNQICVRLAPGADIKRVEADIDKAIGKNLIGITAREDTTSGNSISAFISQFKTLSAVFPLLFFLVTALITQSTMLRLVEKQRGEIGVLKALGYSKRSILWHYTSYGTYIGLLGAFLGLLIGPNLFGRILVPRLNLTFPNYNLSINYVNFTYSLILILLCTGGVSLFACLKLLGETPSSLLRDKPPKEGGHIILERFPKLWNRMRFSSKLIARNTVKNKSRFFMSILGIMGCAGLIVGAIALNDMISGISDDLYGSVFLYDKKIILDAKADSRLVRNKKLDGIVQEVKDLSVEIICPDGTRVMKPLTVLTDESPLIKLRDEEGKEVRMSGSGIALSRKLADNLHLKLGDAILFKRANEDYASVTVDRIYYMAAGQGMYMSQSAYEALGETFKPSSILVKWSSKPDEAFINSEYVSEYVDISVQRENTDSNTTVVLIAASMLISMGAILAFVVLYNSSILNYTERIRDLATLAVLGFYQREIRALVLTENILSVILGTILGVPLGKGLVDVIASTLDSRLDLIGKITPINVLLSGTVTLIFALVVNRSVAKKMKDLDMLDALKSVE